MRGLRSIISTWLCRKEMAAAREMLAGRGVIVVNTVRLVIFVVVMVIMAMPMKTERRKWRNRLSSLYPRVLCAQERKQRLENSTRRVERRRGRRGRNNVGKRMRRQASP
jgi:hypothetical protein